MPGRRLPEPYSVDYFRNCVKDSLSYLGEQVIVLSTYHVIPDEGVRERCECYDDIYENTDNFKCPMCYGTTFAGGVKQAVRSWAMFTDTTNTEDVTRQGVWNPDKRQVQLEWYPPLMQRDYVVRVPKDRWQGFDTPAAVAGIYRIGEVVSDSLRQGQYEGQIPADISGQKGTVDLISKDMAIYQYPIIGQAFPRWDGRQL